MGHYIQTKGKILIWVTLIVSIMRSWCGVVISMDWIRDLKIDALLNNNILLLDALNSIEKTTSVVMFVLVGIIFFLSLILMSMSENENTTIHKIYLVYCVLYAIGVQGLFAWLLPVTTLVNILKDRKIKSAYGDVCVSDWVLIVFTALTCVSNIAALFVSVGVL